MAVEETDLSQTTGAETPHPSRKEAERTMASLTSSFPSIDANAVVQLHVFLPFVLGLLASRLIYGWIDKAGLQSVGFSPIVASILTTPLLACAYYMLLVGFLPHYFGIKVVLYKMLFVLVLFGPIILPLSLLLAIYLRGGFRRKKIFGIILCAATVALVVLEFLGLYFQSDHFK